MNFDKISGYENEKKELLHLRNMLKNAKRYRDLGIRIPRGIVLYGDPGVGKSVMARAIADEEIAVVELRAADCCSDNTESSVRSVFEEAKKKAPCVLILDELDKIAGTSQHFFMEDNDSVKKILLQELDGIGEEDEILVAATCNDIDCLGDALIRPGRFDRTIFVPNPDEKTRYKILSHYLSRIEIKKNINVRYLAKITQGFTGAMIECLVNEAGIYAIEKNKKGISLPDIKIIMNRMFFHGYEKDPLENKEELRKIAVHEAGHAIAALYHNPDKIQEVSIKPHRCTGGYVEMLRDEDSIPSVSEAENDIRVLLAGGVAEKMVFGEKTVGSMNDYSIATSKMMSLIVKVGAYGYKYLMVHMNRHPLGYEVSDNLREQVEVLFEQKLKEFDADIENTIERHREQFDKIVEELIDRQIISREELFEIAEVRQAA